MVAEEKLVQREHLVNQDHQDSLAPLVHLVHAVMVEELILVHMVGKKDHQPHTMVTNQLMQQVHQRLCPH